MQRRKFAEAALKIRHSLSRGHKRTSTRAKSLVTKRQSDRTRPRVQVGLHIPLRIVPGLFRSRSGLPQGRSVISILTSSRRDRRAAIGKAAAFRNAAFSESPRTDYIPRSWGLTVRLRCIGARQATRLGGADSMTGSEKTRQTNLRIGGAMARSAYGRLYAVATSPENGRTNPVSRSTCSRHSGG